MKEKKQLNEEQLKEITGGKGIVNPLPSKETVGYADPNCGPDDYLYSDED